MGFHLNALYYLCSLLLLSDVLWGNIHRANSCQFTEGKPCNLERSSLFWEIKRPHPSPPAYLFGTIHVPYSKVWDFIPQTVKTAFSDSDHIVFELNLRKQQTITEILSCQLLPSGIKLLNILPKALFLQLKRHLEYVKAKTPLWLANKHLDAEDVFKRGTAAWERKRPIWIVVMLNNLKSNIRYYGIPNLDTYLANEAQNLNKKIGSVERPRDQCKILNRMNISQALFWLNQTLFQHESIERSTADATSSTDELIHHYNCGNLTEVVFNHDTQFPFAKLDSQEQLEISKKINDYFRTNLIVNRNIRMARQIVKYLKSYPNDSFFFAFGVGHFLGNSSIIELLQEHGLEVSQVNDYRPIGRDCHYSHYPSGPMRGSSGAPTSSNQKMSFSSSRVRGGSLPRNIGINPVSSLTRTDVLRDSDQRITHVNEPASSKFRISEESVFYPLPLLPYGQNSWPNSFLNSPLHLGANNSRPFISVNDYFRSFVLNNNNAIGHLPADRHSAHLSSSTRPRANHHYYSWSPPLTSASRYTTQWNTLLGFICAHIALIAGL